MTGSYQFLKSILDTITEHIAVIDQEGNILFVNRSWVNFGNSNQCQLALDWEKVNYLEICDKSAAMGDEFGRKAGDGIRKVINKELSLFYFEYPCHSPDEQRWFIMRVTPFTLNNHCYFVISHQNITERKLAEEKVRDLSRLDELTQIANRRSFNEFLHDQWQRSARLKMAISLAMIDLDHFKMLNDYYGHHAGDSCLQKVAETLAQFVRRPSDICARYGGEEFVMVFGNTGIEASLDIVHKMLDAIRNLRIPNEKSPVKPMVTASVGLVSMYPDGKIEPDELIKAADALLYSAKATGRNQVIHNSVE